MRTGLGLSKAVILEDRKVLHLSKTFITRIIDLKGMKAVHITPIW
jgi:hypothetical protein